MNQNLVSFVENMRANGNSDDAIEEMLVNAGHPADAIDAALHPQADSGKDPQPAVAKPASEDEIPITERTATVSVVKRGDGHLKAAEPKPPTKEPVETATTPPEPAVKPATGGKRVIAPRADYQPPKEEPKKEEPKPQPPAAPAIDDRPAPEPVAPTPPPQEESESPASIYPAANLGSAAPTPPIAPIVKPADTTGVNYPEYPLNTLVLAQESAILFFKNLIPMLGISIFGALIGTGLLYLSGKLSEQIIEATAGFWLWAALAPELLSIPIWMMYYSVVYGAFFGVFLAIWRTPVANMAYDIVSGLKPSFINSMVETVRDFPRHYLANAVLAAKLMMVYTGFIFIFLRLVYGPLLRYAFEGGTTGVEVFRWSVIILLLLFINALMIVIARNSFISQLMINRGDVPPLDASRRSRELLSNPRSKFFELFGWTMLIYAVIHLVDFIYFQIAGESQINNLEIIQSLGQTFDFYDILPLLGVATFLFTFTSIYELGIARYFAASKGIEENAKPLANTLPIAKYVLLASSLLIIALQVIAAHQS